MKTTFRNYLGNVSKYTCKAIDVIQLILNNMEANALLTPIVSIVPMYRAYRAPAFNNEIELHVATCCRESETHCLEYDTILISIRRG
jgi:hypothetical protein